MTTDNFHVVSRNLDVIEEIQLLEGLLCYNDVVCVQEYFLFGQAVNLLEINDGVKSFVVAASSVGRGRPSAGVALLISSILTPPFI